jgi:hypothetical protein
MPLYQAPNLQLHWIDDDTFAHLLPEGCTKISDNFQEPVPEPINLPAYAASRRYLREVGGITWEGHPISTDRESQNKLLAEYVAVFTNQRIDPSYWKMADGSFVPLTNTQMSALALAVKEHVRDAFFREGMTLGGISGGTITTTQQIDEAFA